MAFVVAVAGPDPEVACLVTNVARPRSSASAAVVASTSDAAPLADSARERRRRATSAAAVPNATVVADGSPATSSSGAVGRGAGRTTGPTPMPGTTAVPE
jgi:hypothetical protein